MNNRQVTDTIMMIRPSCFAFNASTAVDNVYQNSYKDNMLESEISEKASFEFDEFVNVLKSEAVNVIQFTDLYKNNTPDSIFPNNWISTHIDGSVWLYPMLSINRRAERRQDIIDYLNSKELDFNYFVFLDVFIYLGDLDNVFQLIYSQNKTSGKLIFTTENNKKGNYFLEQTGRYSHSKSYIEMLCDKYNYNITYYKNINLRKENTEFINGGLYILEFHKN